LIYVVLGMHKSGTSLVSQILHHSGINMGERIDPDVPYDDGNKYERQSALALNVEILGLGSVRVRSLNAQVPSVPRPTDHQRARMREIVQVCSEAHMDWGFKDPRTCLTYHLWACELPEHKIIAIYRPLGEIWPRFREGRFSHAYRNPSKAWTVTKAWCRYNSSVLDHLQTTTMDFLVLSYRDLVTSDTEFKRLGAFVGRDLSDQRRPALYRSRLYTGWLVGVMSWLARWRLGCAPADVIQRFENLRREGAWQTESGP